MLLGSKKSAQNAKHVELVMKNTREIAKYLLSEHEAKKMSSRLSRIDLFIKHNLKASEDQKVTIEFIVSTFSDFFISAFDTSKNSIEKML